MRQSRIGFLFLNIGHFLDHLILLIFATAALRLMVEWDMSYAELIPYTTPAFIAFGLVAIPAGWLGDKWSREGMMVVFFIGLGTCSALTSMASTPVQLAIGLTLIGVFSAIYHPIGLAMVVQGLQKTGMPLAINGVFGNMGVASAALLTGYLIDHSGWRSAFLVPGATSIVIGFLYLWFVLYGAGKNTPTQRQGNSGPEPKTMLRSTLLRIFTIILFTTALGGIVFQSTTFALPKVFDERLGDFAGSATEIGQYVFLVFAAAAFAQLVVGYLLDHYPARTIFATVAILQAVFFFIMTQVQGIAALLVALAFMLVVFGQIPINDVLVGRIARSEWRSRAYALRYIVTFTVSASAVPLIAWVHSTRGFSALFSLLAVAALTIFIATLFLPGKEHRTQAA